MARPGNKHAVKSGVHVKNPLVVLECIKCAAAPSCPMVNRGPEGRCWYELYDVKPDLTTAEGIISLLRQKTELEYIRYQRALRYATAQGRQSVDKETTTLSNTITKDLTVLADMSVRFGTIEETKSTAPVTQQTFIQTGQVNLLQITQGELDQCKILQAELEALRNQRESIVAPLTLERNK